MIIAFLGLGAMGGPMAQRLALGGHEVRGHDVSAAARERFVQAGGSLAHSVQQAVEGADLVVTMLPDEQVVETVLFGPGGAAESMRSGALLLEMSTSDAAFIHRCARMLALRGARTMDVPVARGVREAASGELLVLAGGSAEDFAAALPALRCLGTDGSIVHVGPLGTAIRLKLINNYLAMVNMVVAAEGLTFARAAGIDREVAVRVLQSTPAGKGQLSTNYPRKVLRGDVEPDFPLRMGLKDMTLALKLGAELAAPLYLGASARQAFSLAAAWGREEQDCTAMLHLLEDIGGLRRGAGTG